jgi:16S rRNA (cytosine967-C5)-methyltransferase
MTEGGRTSGAPGLRMEGLPARRAALRVLQAVSTGQPFDQALTSALAPLAEADRRLAHELAAGVLRRRADLDARLMPLARQGWGSVAPAIRDVLRIAAYQLTALDRIPPHAAVSTAVDLARAEAGDGAAKFVNAVLRNLGGRTAPPPLSIDPAGHLAAMHSHPDWLVARWLARYGREDTVQLLEWNNTRPALVLQPARDDDAALASRWRAAGVSVEPAALGAGWLSPARRPADVPGYAEGAFFVQDPAQAMVVRFAAATSGMTVYDAAAAPGGKSIGLGRAARCVISGDLGRERVKRLAQNLARAGSGREHAVVADAIHPPVASADLVLLDAPCLGTGTLGRHPDARWRVSPEGLARVVERQHALLRALADVVRPGAWLVYATCSLEPEENEEQVSAFLSEDRRFVRDPATTVPPSLVSSEGDLRLLPQRDGTDGAYAARLRRVS